MFRHNSKHGRWLAGPLARHSSKHPQHPPHLIPPRRSTALTDTVAITRTTLPKDAADAAYQARVAEAITRFTNQFGMAALVERRISYGIDHIRGHELSLSTRNAESPAEFQSFANTLRVSARWLAIGFGRPTDTVSAEAASVETEQV